MRTILGAALLAVMAVGCSTPPPTSGPPSIPASPGPVAQSGRPSIVLGETGIGDGTFRVGSDVEPGIYRTRAPSANCYWERLSGFSGAPSDTIANQNSDAPAVVTIKPTDAGFISSSCAPWVTDLSAITSSKSTFGDGTYIVGTDFTPGLFMSAGGAECYWELLSGFGGTNADIISNGLPTGQAVVMIKPNGPDVGFSSHSCGTWTRLP